MTEAMQHVVVFGDTGCGNILATLKGIYRQLGDTRSLANYWWQTTHVNVVHSQILLIVSYIICWEL